MLNITFIPFDQIGAFTTKDAIAVNSSSAQSYTITAGKKVAILQNVGTGIAWIGGSDVSPSDNKGVKLLPNVMLIFRNAKSTFKIYFKCAATITTTIGIAEAD